MKVESLSRHGTPLGATGSRRGDSSGSTGPAFESFLDTSSPDASREEVPRPAATRERGKDARDSASRRAPARHAEDEAVKPVAGQATAPERPAVNETSSAPESDEAEYEEPVTDAPPETLLFAGIPAMLSFGAVAREGVLPSESTGADTRSMLASISYSLLDGPFSGLTPAMQMGAVPEAGRDRGEAISSEALEQPGETSPILTRGMLAALRGEQASMFRQLEPDASNEPDQADRASGEASAAGNEGGGLSPVFSGLESVGGSVRTVPAPGESTAALMAGQDQRPETTRDADQKVAGDNGEKIDLERVAVRESSSLSSLQAQDLQGDIALKGRTSGLGPNDMGGDSRVRSSGANDRRRVEGRKDSESEPGNAVERAEAGKGMDEPLRAAGALQPGRRERGMEQEGQPGSSHLSHDPHELRSGPAGNPEFQRQLETQVAAGGASEAKPAEAGEWPGRVRLAIAGALGSAEGAGRKAVVELQDSDLGRIRIEVSMHEGRIKLDMWAEQEDARRMLRDSRHVLQEELARHQMQLDQFEVGGGMDRQADGSRYQPPAFGGQAGARGTARGMASSVPVPRMSTHEGQIDTIA